MQSPGFPAWPAKLGIPIRGLIFGINLGAFFSYQRFRRLQRQTSKGDFNAVHSVYPDPVCALFKQENLINNKLIYIDRLTDGETGRNRQARSNVGRSADRRSPLVKPAQPGQPRLEEQDMAGLGSSAQPKLNGLRAGWAGGESTAIDDRNATDKIRRNVF